MRQLVHSISSLVTIDQFCFTCVKEKLCQKHEKNLKFCPNYLKIFLSLLTSLKVLEDIKNDQVLVKKYKILVHSVLFQFKQVVVANLYLELKWKVVLFEIYQIQVFFRTQLLQIPILTVKEASKILISAENLFPKGSELN